MFGIGFGWTIVIIGVVGIAAWIIYDLFTERGAEASDRYRKRRRGGSGGGSYDPYDDDVADGPFGW